MTTFCSCQCDECLDCGCAGELCRTRPLGSWVVVLPFNAHPYPVELKDEQQANRLADALRSSFLQPRVEQVKA